MYAKDLKKGKFGPFYHGTKADLKVGDLLTAGRKSNYHPDVIMNHIYFTLQVNGAGLAAELAPGDAEPRVYMVILRTTPMLRIKNSQATLHNPTEVKLP